MKNKKPKQSFEEWRESWATQFRDAGALYIVPTGIKSTLPTHLVTPVSKLDEAWLNNMNITWNNNE